MSKIEEVITLKETDYLTLYDLKYTNRLGQKKSWSAVSRKKKADYEKRLFNKESKKDAVLIAAYHEKQDKLVLVKQIRVPINDYIYEIPAGLIDMGEDTAVCAKRELKEETGLEIKKIVKIQKNAFISPGMTDECADLAIVICDGKICYDYLEPDEDIEIVLCSKEELEKLINSGENLDIKTIMTINMFLYAKQSYWNL